MSGSSKFFFILSGIVSIILGIFLLLNPVINLIAFAWLFSIIFFVSAVSSIINYFTLSSELRSGWYLISGIIVRVLFPQVGHRTHFIVSIFFSILTSKYYPTKFIKFIATVFKFLLLDYLTAEKECFHIGLLFTCHFFVFLILYPPVQQIA